MNCMNQQMAGMPDYIPQNGRVPMPAWQMPVMQPPVMQPPMSFGMQMENGQFPLAMSYVPMQRFTQPSPLEEGFRRGTIFRELDLPFERGRCR